jgi:hypothetical protein
LSAAAIALLNQVRTTTVTSTDGSVTVTPALSVSPGGTNNYNLSVPAVNQMSFFWTKNYDANTESITGLTRLGSIWKTPAANPVLSAGMAAWLSVLHVDNLFNVDQQFKVDVNIVLQKAAKAYDPPQLHINSMVRAAIASVPTTGTSDSFDIMFFDNAATSPQYRDIPIGYSTLGNLLDVLVLEITIYQ